MRTVSLWKELRFYKVKYVNQNLKIKKKNVNFYLILTRIHNFKTVCYGFEEVLDKLMDIIM